jgi:hypothetical protein
LGRGAASFVVDGKGEESVGERKDVISPLLLAWPTFPLRFSQQRMRHTASQFPSSLSLFHHMQ